MQVSESVICYLHCIHVNGCTVNIQYPYWLLVLKKYCNRFTFNTFFFSGGESFPAVKKTLSERLGKKMILPVIAPDAYHKKSMSQRVKTYYLKLCVGLNTVLRITHPL